MAGQKTPAERWAAIEDFRELSRLSWVDIARMAEVSESTLHNYHKGREPRHRILARIEAALVPIGMAPEMAEAAE